MFVLGLPCSPSMPPVPGSQVSPSANTRAMPRVAQHPCGTTRGSCHCKGTNCWSSQSAGSIFVGKRGFGDNCNHPAATVHCSLATLYSSYLSALHISLCSRSDGSSKLKSQRSQASRNLILTADLKHRGEQVGEPVSMDPSGPTNSCCFECVESHMLFGNFFTCSASYAEPALPGISADEMPKAQIG